MKSQAIAYYWQIDGKCKHTVSQFLTLQADIVKQIQLHVMLSAGALYILSHAYNEHNLTLSLPILLRLYTLPYWSNPPFLIFDIRALWHSGLSVRVPECQK